MYKKLAKTILAFLILFNFITNAAVVSDSDGNAFVTKGEFEILKANFNNQIDDYNKSISRKIDGAIATYLDGISVGSNVDISLFYPMNTSVSSMYKIYSVEPTRNGINKQYFNNVQLGITWMHYSYTLTSLRPWINDTYESNFCYFSLGLDNISHSAWYSPTMEGYIFDKDNPTLLNGYYKKDILNIIGSISVHGNNDGGRNNDGMRIANETLFDSSSIQLNKSFIIGTLAKPIAGVYSSSNGTGYLDRNTIKINDYWPTAFIHDSAHQKSWARMAGAGSYPTSYLSDSWLITESKSNEDKNLYLYNMCNASIYAHADSETSVERFTDNASYDGIDAKNSNLVWDDFTNRTKPISYGVKVNPTTGAEQGNGFDGGDMTRGWFYVLPKIRLKNTYIAQETTTKWNNLNQFKNGYLEYTDGDRTTNYPHYYGGLPLFTLQDKPERLSGNIKVAPTTSGYTGNIRVWVKEDEFINNNNITTWGSTDKDKLMKLSSTVSGCSYDNTNKCLIIPQNTEVKFNIEGAEKGKTYFLRFAEADKTYGGEITFLDNFILAKEG